MFGKKRSATENEIVEMKPIIGASPENGDLVRDQVTGFTGIVICKSTNLYNCDRVGIQSQDLVDGNIKDPQWFDVPQVEVLEKGRIKPIPTNPHEIGKVVMYFDLVRDKITKLEGTVVGYGVWLNGCIRIDIHPSIIEEKRNEIPDSFWMHPKRLELVNEGEGRMKIEVTGPTTKPETIVKKTESTFVHTGGPMKAPKLHKQRMG